MQYNGNRITPSWGVCKRVIVMKNKHKDFFKKNLIGFILGILSAGTVSVIAATYFPSNDVTYDNGTSGLSSKNVQGAIDELYGVCTAKTGGEWILDNVDIVTSGEGLYEDEYEDGKYTYKGANPNNYVTFNNEKAGWRIISINSDGTIKIMRDADIGNIAWDTSNSNNWNRPASLNTYLNSTYYKSLTSIAQSQIVEATYYAGGVTYNNNDMQNQIKLEKVTTSNVKVALPTLSEFIRACSNTSCKTFSKYRSNYNTCKNSDWMFDSSSKWWTLSSYSGISYYVFIVNNIGLVANPNANTASIAVRPTVTLSSDVQITGGNGTQSDPYILS